MSPGARRLAIASGLLGSAVACGAASPAATAREERPPPPPERLHALALDAAGGGEFIRAEQYANAARARGFSDEQSTRLLIRVCLASGRVRSALAYAARYLAAHPDHDALRYLVAALRFALGDPLSARRELQEIVSRTPANAPAHYLLALVERDGFGDEAAARSAFGVYLRLSPDGPHAAEARRFLSARRDPDEGGGGPGRRRWR